MSQGLSHLHRQKDLEPYPHPEKWKRRFDAFMYFLGIVAPLALIPQFIAVWVHHETAGISISSWILLGVMNVLWMIYGLIHKAAPIVISNMLFALINFTVALGAVLFR